VNAADGELRPTELAALALRFLDDLAMAATAYAKRRLGVIERIVAAFQEIAERRQVRYVKIMTDQIVAVEGFDQSAHQAAITLGEVALALQDECSRGSRAVEPSSERGLI
jgi:hypothetical protein